MSFKTRLIKIPLSSPLLELHPYRFSLSVNALHLQCYVIIRAAVMFFIYCSLQNINKLRVNPTFLHPFFKLASDFIFFIFIFFWGGVIFLRLQPLKKSKQKNDAWWLTSVFESFNLFWIFAAFCFSVTITSFQIEWFSFASKYIFM